MADTHDDEEDNNNMDQTSRLPLHVNQEIVEQVTE
jgi:hypothetical protein